MSDFYFLMHKPANKKSTRKTDAFQLKLFVNYLEDITFLVLLPRLVVTFTT